MSLTPKQVHAVAALAKLELTDTQAANYAIKISNILTYVDQMNSVDTSNVEPMAHPYAHTQPTRVDLVTETNQRDKMQNIAPATENGLYLVPKVIE